MQSAPTTPSRPTGATPLASEPADAVRFRGYARSRPATPAPVQERPPSAPPTPVAKRPKGRLFLGAVLCAAIVWPAIEVWNAFFRYHGHGIVEGRVIQLSPPFDGEIANVLVREGEWVEQGALLATVRSLELEHERERVDDALRIERATLEARLGELQLEAALRAEARADRRLEASADHLTAVGELLRERSVLERIEGQRRRREGLLTDGVVSDESFGELVLAERGQRSKVEMLERATEELRRRAELAEPEESAAARILRPHLLRLAALREEREQLAARLAEGEVRAPVGGRVIARACFVGERATKGRSLFSVLENDSLHVLLYVSQEQSRDLEVGEELALRLEPRNELVTCTVERKGAEMEPAPRSLQRHFTSDARLLPITLALDPELRRAGYLRVGETATWPRKWRWPFGDAHDGTRDVSVTARSKKGLDDGARR